MGCNTSKEMQTAEDQQQENNANQQEEGGSEKQVKSDETIRLNGEVVEEKINEEDKSASARTATAKSSSRPNSKAETLSNPRDRDEEEQTVVEVLGEEKAATTIQAAYRGHQTRKSMKQSCKPGSAAQQEPEPEPTREQLEAEFREDDKELCHAATKIQASFRGHMARKDKEGKGEGEGDGKKEDVGPSENPEEEVDIDLNDPEVTKAAVKIQASFRGHMARKEVPSK